LRRTTTYTPTTASSPGRIRRASVTDNIVSYDNTSTDNILRYTRKGGSDGNTYKITVRCTSVNGAKLEQDIVFKVQEY